MIAIASDPGGNIPNITLCGIIPCTLSEQIRKAPHTDFLICLQFKALFSDLFTENMDDLS